MTQLSRSHVIDSLKSKNDFDRVTSRKEKPTVSSVGFKIPSDSGDESKDGTVIDPIIANSPNLYKQKGEHMSKGFIQLNRTYLAEDLMAKHPFAYLLLNLIALRARWKPGIPDGLQMGEAYIGDYKSFGATRQQYRTSLRILVELKFVTIQDTKKNRQKSTINSTIKTTIRGTKVKLLDSAIWDINSQIDNHHDNHQINQLPTNCQPTANHKQERSSSSSSFLKKDKYLKGTILNDKTEHAERESSLLNEIKKSEEPVSEDLIIASEFSKTHGIPVTEKELDKWVRKWGGHAVLESLILSTKQKNPIKSYARWMEASFKNDWTGLKKNEKINGKIAEDFKNEKKWQELRITKKYVTIDGAGYDVPMNLNPDIFMNILTEKYGNLHQ